MAIEAGPLQEIHAPAAEEQKPRAAAPPHGCEGEVLPRSTAVPVSRSFHLTNALCGLRERFSASPEGVV
jgi:hypothetical protein